MGSVLVVSFVASRSSFWRFSANVLPNLAGAFPRARHPPIALRNRVAQKGFDDFESLGIVVLIRNQASLGAQCMQELKSNDC